MKARPCNLLKQNKSQTKTHFTTWDQTGDSRLWNLALFFLSWIWLGVQRIRIPTTRSQHNIMEKNYLGTWCKYLIILLYSPLSVHGVWQHPFVSLHRNLCYVRVFEKVFSLWASRCQIVSRYWRTRIPTLSQTFLSAPKLSLRGQTNENRKQTE